MARDARHDRAPVYEAAGRFVDGYLRSDGSMFTPGVSIATRGNLDDLHARFNEQPDAGSDSFLDKFEVQLSAASDAVTQLAAELLYLHLVIADDIGGKSKRETIGRVTAWMEEPIAVPPELDAALDHGLANTGIAFKTYRPNQLWLLIDVLRAWKRRPSEERSLLLEDAWAFKAFLFQVPLTAAYTQREALLHLVHPDAFEPIVSREHKRQLVEAFVDRTDGAEDVDRALLAIRRSLEAERPDFRNFYEPGIVEAWRPGDDEADPPRAQVRAWLVRHKVAGKPRLPSWLEDGYASIGWQELGPDVIGLPRTELSAAVDRTFPDDPPGRRRGAVGNIDRFLRQMKTGDVIVTADGDEIYVGLVASAPRYADGVQEAYRRAVEWANSSSPLSRSDLSESAYSKLRALQTVSDISDDAAEFIGPAGLVPADHSTDDEAAPARRKEIGLPSADAILADELLLPSAWLQDVIDLLEEKRQVIFYGPPGTGKTFVAQRLADHLTQRGGSYVIVQFHPSYAYEDFFEGFRPREDTGGSGVSFELVPGPFRRLAEQAAAEPDSPHVLIIDEINRANLAKVFGELYFLLEYRDHAIALQYSPEADEFELPPNLYIVGTMNTADRSIALVDAAMRRRFYFVGFFPQREPIDGLLERWLVRHGLDTEPARLLAELNSRIDDEDFAVGPSYLMDARSGEPGRLERIWDHAVLPLLEEHYIGTSVEVGDRFAIAALRAAVAIGSSGSDEDVLEGDQASGDPTLLT